MLKVLRNTSRGGHIKFGIEEEKMFVLMIQVDNVNRNINVCPH